MAIPPAQSEPAEPLLNAKWRRVEQLTPRELLGDANGEGGEDEWEEDEVEYVTLDFGPYLEARALAEYNNIQILAPESQTPMALLGDRYFQGVHERLVGTDILLRRDENASPMYKPFATSTHRITFQPVALVPPAGPAHAIGVPPAARGRGRLYRGAGGAARGASSQPTAESTQAVGPDGTVKPKRGRPKGSKNKLKKVPPAGSTYSPAPARGDGSTISERQTSQDQEHAEDDNRNDSDATGG